LPQPVEIVSVDPNKLDAYVGRFLVNPDRVLTITKENGKLYAEPTQSPKVELFPISETEFFRKDADVRYTFIKADGGRVDRIAIRLGTGGSEAPRLSNDVMIPYEQLMAGKTAEAIESYRKIKREKPNNVVIQEARFNELGYSLLREKKVAQAIAVFKVNVELYPQSSNVYDSLGEAYMANGEKELARANYKKSLELNPGNKNAVLMLKKLEP